MPATKSELSNKEEFRGDILDRDFPVHFDAKTGTYSYDYADVSAALASELDKIKYYRVASPKLAEVEAEVVKHLKAEGPKPPPVKGEITKATEQFQKQYGETQNVIEQLSPQINAGTATPEEQEAYKKAMEQFGKLDIQSIVAKAKKQYNYYQGRLNAGENETKFLAEEAEEFKTMKELLEAYEELEGLNEKKNLSPTEKTQKIKLLEYFDSVPSLIYFKKNIVGNITNKQTYNNARAIIKQIEGTPNNKRSAKQLKNLANAKAIVRNFEARNPNAEGKRLETEGLAMYVNAKKKLNALSKKTPPLSAENIAEQARLQNIVNDYSAAFPNTVSREEMGPLQEYNTTGKPLYKNIFAEANVENSSTLEPIKKNSKGNSSLEQGSTPQRELSNVAFQARKTKAEKVLTSIGTLPKPLSGKQEALRENAQAIVNAFAKLNNTTGTVKNANKQTARNLVRKSTFLNKARNLSIATEGGRRTRKAKKSKRKTHKRKH